MKSWRYRVCGACVPAALVLARLRRWCLVFGVMCLAGCGRQQIERVEWPVMGTIAAVQTRGNDLNGDKTSPEATATAMAITKDIQTLLNAHNPDSEISRIAARSEGEILALCDHDKSVDPRLKTRGCYEAAFKLMKASGRAFNPRWRGEDKLDLGAIAKGFAVDVISEKCADGLLVDFLVDLGGNLKSLRGTWKTGVMNPNGEGYAAIVDLHEGEALATSATYYRGSHIYDGRTGKSVTNGVASVTVLCKSAMWADGLSTTLFVLGPEGGGRFLDAHQKSLVGDDDVAVLWILSDGRMIRRDPARRFN